MRGQALGDTEVVESHSEDVYVLVALAVDEAILLGPPLDEDVSRLVLIGDGDGRGIAVGFDLHVLRLLDTGPHLALLVDVDERVVTLIAYPADVLARLVEVVGREVFLKRVEVVGVVVHVLRYPDQSLEAIARRGGKDGVDVLVLLQPIALGLHLLLGIVPIEVKADVPAVLLYRSVATLVELTGETYRR